MTHDPEAGPTGPAFGVPDGAQLWIVRHGATEWSESGKHTGITDVPLTAAGKRQAAAVRAVLGDVRPVLVLCSPRTRALDTARLAGLDVDDVTDDLREWDYGDYEGLTTPQIRQSDPGWTVWTHRTPGGETADQVAARADRVLARALSRLADGPVVLVGHGHFSRVLGARWIGLPATAGAHLVLATAAPSLLGAEHGVPALVHWNLPNPVAP